MQYFFYILYSEELDLYYIGSSADPQKRLIKHLSQHKGFTAKAKDWRICFTETYTSKTDALKRERQLKKWKNRRRIQDLIARLSVKIVNPDD